MVRSTLLARVNFPMYTVQCLTPRHVLVAGGGGASNTGIRNAIEIYELINEGSGCRAESVADYEAGKMAIMNSATYKSEKFFILFAGMENVCQLYKLKANIKKEYSSSDSGKVKNSVLRQRKPKASENEEEELSNTENTKPTPSDNVSSPPSKITFDVKPLESFQTDFSEELFQKVVRFSSALKILATAGADGYIRVWKYPEMMKLYEIHAHNDHVDDLDISPLGDKIISVSRDGTGKIWNTKDGSLNCKLESELPPKTTGKYIYRSCRFALIESNPANIVFFLTMNPAVRQKPPSKCFLSRWNGKNLVSEKIISVGTDMISTMAVSDNGRYVAIGTQDGGVKIYIAFSLQLLYRADKVHGIFVTGLEFLKTCEESKRIIGGKDAGLISISVDNHINIHFVPQKTYISMFGFIVFFMLFLFIVFIVMDYYNI